MSNPKPVGLTGHSWRYKIATEDLNGDKVAYRAVRLPKYARFDKKKAIVEWTPRKSQLGINDIILMALDEQGATSTQENQEVLVRLQSFSQLLLRWICWTRDFNGKLKHRLTKNLRIIRKLITF